MKAVTFAALVGLVSVLMAFSAHAQAPSLEDLARIHGGGLSPGGSSGGGGGAKPDVTPAPAPSPSGANSAAFFGAIAFTADGSYSTAWKYKTKPEAEAYVATKCSAFGRGECKVIGFVGTLCAGLASYQGSHSGKRYRLAFTGGGITSSEAQKQAMDRCNGDSRTRRRCQLRTVVCGDGR